MWNRTALSWWLKGKRAEAGGLTSVRGLAAAALPAAAAIALLAGCSGGGKDAGETASPQAGSSAGVSPGAAQTSASPGATATTATTAAPGAAAAGTPATGTAPAATPGSPASTPLVGTVLPEHTFDAAFELLGAVRFVTTLEKRSDAGDRLHFYVQRDGSASELPYEPATPLLSDMKAVAFKDADGDGRKDILILADYMTGAGRMGAVPFTQPYVFVQKGTGFEENKPLEERMRDATPYRQLNVQAAMDLTRQSPEEAADKAWSQLAVGDYEQDGSDKYGGATLSLLQVSGSSMTFTLNAFHVTGGDEGIKNGAVNIGDLGPATAKRSYNEMIYRDETDGYELALSLLAPGVLYLQDNGVTRYGMNVTVRGSYSRKTK